MSSMTTVMRRAISCVTSMAVSCHAIIIIVVVVTFAKEVVFYEAFVCLSLFVFVCLSVSVS